MIEVRLTIEDDVPTLARIVSENYSRAFAEYFVPECGCSFTTYPWKPHFYTAISDGVIVGCACYVASWISWGTYSLAWVNTSRFYRRLGVGRALVDRCLNDISSIGSLVTLSTSVPDFYERNWGFKTLQEFFDHHGDSYSMMSLQLKEGRHP